MRGSRTLLSGGYYLCEGVDFLLEVEDGEGVEVDLDGRNTLGVAESYRSDGHGFQMGESEREKMCSRLCWVTLERVIARGKADRGTSVRGKLRDPNHGRSIGGESTRVGLAVRNKVGRNID